MGCCLGAVVQGSGSPAPPPPHAPPHVFLRAGGPGAVLPLAGPPDLYGPYLRFQALWSILQVSGVMVYTPGFRCYKLWPILQVPDVTTWGLGAVVQG